MDEYEVIKMIGEGSFGKVFLAKGKDNNQPCVIKEINLTKVNNLSSHLSQMRLPFRVMLRTSFTLMIHDIGNWI